MNVHDGCPARQAGGGDSPRRPRIPWRFLTRLFGFLAAFFGLVKVTLELWLWLHTA